MINKFNFILLTAFLSFLSHNAYSYYFTIQLNNGNKIEIENYKEIGENILFFTKGGFVILPKKIIRNIIQSDGNLESSVFYLESESSDDNALIKNISTSDDKQKEEIISDLKDRISVITSNLENLIKNKKTYLSQRDNYIKFKADAEDRLESVKKAPFVSSEDIKERIELEQSKIMDADKKIEEIEKQIQDTEKMFESQKRMKARLTTELVNQQH